MLLSFTVSGFRGFVTPATLSMVATSDKSHRDTHTIETGLSAGFSTALRAAVIVGANASGKTSFLEALLLLTELISHSRRYSTTEFARLFQPHVFDDKRTIETELALELVLDGNRFDYCVAYDARGITRESLVQYAPSHPRRIFERIKDDGQFSDRQYTYAYGTALKGRKSDWANSTRATALYLSTLIENNNNLVAPIHHWVTKQFIYLGSDAMVNDQRMLGILDGLEGDDKAERYKRYLLTLFRCADIPIVDVQFETQDVEAEHVTIGDQTYPIGHADGRPPQYKFYNARFQHERSDGRKFWLSFHKESSGTQRLFSLAGPLFEAKENGCLLVVDEYSSKLSTRLSEHFITLFQSTDNTGDGQLVLTTHDSHLMSLDLMRRDQLWIVDQPEEFCSELVGLPEYKARMGEAIPKNYLEGRYGGIARPRPIEGEIKNSA